METTITPIKEKSQVELKISVTAEELEPYLDAAAKELSKDTPIKGFRPGKATVPVAIETFGKERVLHEALERGASRWFVQAILEHDIEALGRPKTTIEKADIDSGVRMTAIVDILPEVQLGDPSTITLEKRLVVINDERIEEELKYVAKSRSTAIDVARPAQQGDTVVVDFEVFMNSQPMEGGASKQHPVHIGEGHFIPDFETKIQGMQAGDEREFTMQFPDDFANEQLRGKEAQAKVKAHAVQKRVVPKLDDEFAKSLGKFEDVAHLRSEVKKNLQQELTTREEERVRGELTQRLADISTFSAIPEVLVEREIDRRLQELTQMLAIQGKSLSNYLASQGKTHTSPEASQGKTVEDLRSELRTPAERTVKVSLALRQFAHDTDIEVSAEDVAAKAQEYLAQYKDPEEAAKHVKEDELHTHIASTLRNERALDKLVELATITEVPEPKNTEK